MKKNILFLGLCLFYSFAFAAAQNQEVPVRISSDNLSYNQNASQVVFTGHVYVDRQDFELWSQSLTVDLKKGQGKPQAALDDRQAIKKITAKGDVRFKSGDRSAEAGEIIYIADADTIIMTGEPRLKEGKNELRGEKITLYLQENKSEVQGGKKRVEAIFFAPKNEVSLP